MKEKKVDKEKKEADETAEKKLCILRVCEDPKTGELVVLYNKKKCPPGYIEKIAGRMATKGLKFRGVSDEEEDEEE